MEYMKQLTDLNLQDALVFLGGGVAQFLLRSVISWIRKPRELSEVARGVLSKIERAQTPYYSSDRDAILCDDITVYLSSKNNTVCVKDVGPVDGLLTSAEKKTIRKAALAVRNRLLVEEQESQRRKAVASLGGSSFRS